MLENNKKYQLYLGNCLEKMQEFPDNTFDMIFADPPYMLSNDGISCQNGKMVSVNKGSWDKSKGIENDFEFNKKWLSECRRIIKEKRKNLVRGKYHNIYLCGFSMQLLGFHILNDISWFKPNASPNLSCRFFTASHESLIWARKNKKASHTFNYENMKNGNFPNDFLKKPNLQMRSVWAIGTPKPNEKTFGKHPTQKPIDLLDRIILSSTNENDLILDPFCGGGTTGVSCIKLGRRFIGIEKEQDFFELSKKRIEQEINELKLL